jgi:glycosyltransferase involved in cell wall biosynthesis
VNWFVGEVWPLVLQHRTDIKLTIVGSNMPATIRELTAPNVVVAGFVEHIDPLIDRARISIAPLRYGAGVKGKINQAMACGLPVVATDVAAEGMDLHHGEELLVADSPQAFADAVLRLYDDESLWQRLATGGRRNIEKHFSRSVARNVLARVAGVVAPNTVRSDE